MRDSDFIGLTELAGAVLDGTRVDWDAADSQATPDERLLVRRLKTIARIAQAHRADMLDVWGPLRLLERIGHGAFGDVYRAWDSRLDREVALKLLPADPGPSNPLVTSIIEEGRLLARVRHPNVVTIYGAERIDDRVGLWMEYIDGRTLHQLVIDEQRRFLPREVETIGQTLCSAVAAVHAAGLLHRDIKAQNVMMARDGRVVLMDFGSGRDRSGQSASLAGTPLYLAPELLTAASSSSAQTDLYSIGVLLFFLLTGTYPVTAANLTALRAAHERGERRALKTLAPTVPRPLRRSVERATAPLPQQRYESAEAMATALKYALAGRTKVVSGVIAAAGMVVAVLITTMSPPSTQGDSMAIAARGASGSGAPQRYATNLPRYEEYLRARALVEEGRIAAPSEAAKIFERIAADDPQYAPAHAGLALAYAILSISPYQGASNEVAAPRMRSAASEALRLDPMLAEAHAARGWVHARDFEWAEAERAFRRAIDLNPRLMISYTSFTYSTLQPLGRVLEAEQLLRQAAHIHQDAAALKLAMGRVLLQANRPAAVIALLEPLRRTDSDLLVIDQFLGRALMLDGRVGEALPLLDRRRMRLVDPTRGPEPWVASAYVMLGRRAEAEKLARDNDHLPFRRAVINAALGNTDRMFDGLEEMADGESQRLAHLLRAPEFASFRHEQRFTRLLARMRLKVH